MSSEFIMALFWDTKIFYRPTLSPQFACALLSHAFAWGTFCFPLKRTYCKFYLAKRHRRWCLGYFHFKSVLWNTFCTLLTVMMDIDIAPLILICLVFKQIKHTLLNSNYLCPFHAACRRLTRACSNRRLAQAHMLPYSLPFHFLSLFTLIKRPLNMLTTFWDRLTVS